MYISRYLVKDGVWLIFIDEVYIKKKGNSFIFVYKEIQHNINMTIEN